MNILLLHTVDFPNGGAESAHAALIVSGLRKNGKKAYLIIPHGCVLGDETNNVRIKGHFRGVPYFYMNGKTTRSYNIFRSFLEIYSGMLNSALFVFKRRLRRKKDVLIIGTPDVSRYFPVIACCILLRVPFFIWAVEKSTSNPWKLRMKSGLTSYFGFKLAESILPYFSSGCMVISTRLRELYLKYLPERRIIVYPILVDANTVYDDELLSSVARLREMYDGKRLIVYSGTFAEKDGIRYLLDAFSSVIETCPDAHFVMTGKCSSPIVMQNVRDYIVRLELNDHVELVGFISREDLTCYNLIADILLVCRTNSDYANYGFPWKLGEYCMTGRPILATNVSDIERYFEDGKSIFIVEAENSEAIAGRMISILENHDESLLIAENAKMIARMHFDYIGQTKKIIEFMNGNM